MPVGAAIAGGLGAVGSIGSAVIGSNAAKNAANAQLQAAQTAQQTQLNMFNTAQAAEQPYNTVGQGAVKSLADLYGIPGSGSNIGNGGASTGGNSGALNSASLDAFTNSPDYKFAFDQGMQGLQRAAAAGGTLISGGQLKAGQEFGQGLASQQFGNYFNRLLSLSQLGQSAAGGISSAAGTAGAQIGNSIQAGGQAAASGMVGSANALSGGLTGATTSLGQAALLSKLGGLNASPSVYATGAPSLAAFNTGGTGLSLTGTGGLY